MKIRVFSLILALAILASLMVAPAQAWGAGSDVTSLEGACPCGCGKTLDKVQWKPWAGDAATGHYYLEEDYIQDSQKESADLNLVFK